MQLARESAKRYRVLVVDDDPMMLRLMSALLSVDNDVFTRSSGREALGALGQDAFHVVCADYQMPGMDGIELLERAALAGSDAGLVLVTGSDEYFRRAERKEHYVLLKPFDPGRLCSFVGQIARIVEIKRSVKSGGYDRAGEPAAEPAPASAPPASLLGVARFRTTESGQIHRKARQR